MSELRDLLQGFTGMRGWTALKNLARAAHDGQLLNQAREVDRALDAVVVAAWPVLPDLVHNGDGFVSSWAEARPPPAPLVARVATLLGEANAQLRVFYATVGSM